jgi:hypothetical protein
LGDEEISAEELERLKEAIDTAGQVMEQGSGRGANAEKGSGK